MSEEVRLGELKKYVPFMDYILQLNYKYKDKFAKMREWIVENKKFSKVYFEKIEQSIIVTYKDFGVREDFPKDLHKIFTVDLCSDDESENDAAASTKENAAKNTTKTVPSKELQNNTANPNCKSTTDTVTISDHENDDDLEIVAVTTKHDHRNIVNFTFDDRSHKRNKQNTDHNEKIFERINSASALTAKSPEPITDKRATFDHMNEDNNDQAIFRRRKDFTKDFSKEYTVNDITENIFTGESQIDVVPKPKKRKRKRKKEKKHHHRSEKHKTLKQNFIVVENIILDSSTDDESNNKIVTQKEKISNLDEPELLKMKNRIMAEIETETNQVLINEAKVVQSTSNSNLSESIQSSGFNESELLQMKDTLMKQIGLDQSTSELLEHLNLAELTEKPLEQVESIISKELSPTSSSNQASRTNIPSKPIPVVDRSQPKHFLSTTPIARNTSYQNSNNLQHIPTIRNQYPTQLPNQFLPSGPNQFVDSHMHLNDTSEIRPLMYPPLPVPPPPLNPPTQFMNRLEALTNNFPTPSQYRSSFPSRPYHPPQMNSSSYVPSPTLAANQPNSTSNHFLPTQANSYSGSRSQYNSSNVLTTPNPPPTQRNSSNLVAIPTSTMQTATQQFQHSTRLPNPSTFTSTTPTTTNPAPILTTVGSTPRDRPREHAGQAPFLHGTVERSATTKPAQVTVPPTTAPIQSKPLHTAVTPQSNPLNGHPITAPTTFNGVKPNLLTKDPRLRKILEEGQYVQKRQPTQAQSTPTPTAPQPLTTIHNWDPATENGTTFSTASGATKSANTYGEHCREMQKKRQLDEENKRRKEEEKRLERERQLQEKRKLERAAKEIEDIELQRQTESIKQILNPHKDNIVDILENGASKKGPQRQRQESISKTIARKKNTISKDRVLKELECTVKGFNKIQDFLMASSDGKRRSSVSARKAIADMLTPLTETTKKSPETSVSASAVDISTRRSSSSSQPRNVDDDSNKAITKNWPKMKRCKVVLHRLTPSEIAKHTSKRRRVSVCEVKAKSQDKLYAAKSARPVIDMKNIDCQMTERNCETCVLCKARSSNLTNHFIRFHKMESYVSRLTWEELDDLLIKVPFAEEVITDKDKKSGAGDIRLKCFRVECPFCPEGKRVITGRFENLRRHYSSHTGEYAFQCKGCGLQKPYRNEIFEHQSRTKCLNAGAQTLYVYPENLMVIYIHHCTICNFVQLNEENVFKHLREQHGKLRRDPKYVKECTLAAIKDGPIERVRIDVLPEIIPSADHCMENHENVVVGNEPVLDDSDYIKPEPMEDEDEFVWNNPRKQSTAPAKGSTSSGISNMNMDTAECFETSAVDIKTEIDAFDQTVFESMEAEIAANTQSELAAMQQEPIIENKPDAEKLTAEAVKALLRKYSSNTGIQPDLLYQCSKPDCRGFYSNFKLWSSHMTTRHNAIISTCPHCVSKKAVGAELELPIPEFEQHFKTHCLRLYVCFHCDTRCVDEQQIRDHARHAHPEISEVRIERIPFNFSYAYHVLVSKETLPIRLDFLIQLSNVLRERVQRMDALAEDSEHVISKWSVPYSTCWLDELSLPMYSPSAATLKCMIPSCPMSFSDQTSFLDHLTTRHDIQKTYLFSCMLCGISSPANTLLTLIKHNFMHSENICVCCVCSFTTYDRNLLTKHICAEHDKRDVAVLSLQRSKVDVKVEIGFVFAAGSRTFTTTTACFCGCGANNLRVDTYVSHLKREHLLKLRYSCEYCNEQLPQLQLSDEHFRTKHAGPGTVPKIRCHLACTNDRRINIISTRPLQIRLSDENYDSIQHDTEPSRKVAIPNAVIKKEVDDEGDVMIMEDDEIIAENEAKEALRVKNAVRSDISCTSIFKLM